jgi:hypothetical protein
VFKAPVVTDKIKLIIVKCGGGHCTLRSGLMTSVLAEFNPPDSARTYSSTYL